MTMTVEHEEVRVLYVTGGRRIGGMESHLLILTSNLPPSIRCVVCCSDASPDYLARLTELGIERENLECPNLLRPGVIRAYRRLTRVVRRFDPHVVHSYGFSSDVIAALLRLGGVKAKIITSRRGEEPHVRRHAILRLINRLSDRIVCVSPETAAFVNATESPRPRLLEVIPNAVELHLTEHRPRARNRESIRFGTLGTVKPIKGTDLLVDAFMRFSPERPVELVIAGLIDRPWAEALRDRARPDPRIRFVGRTSAPRDFLSELDVFVLPSRSEGMSNALLEAMAAGLPCIATDVGSNRSVLCPDAAPAAGVITQATAGSLFQAMETLASSAEARASYGAHGAALVRTRHSISGMVDQYERLYRRVIGRPLVASADGGKDVPHRVTADA
jgi:glycosyltransferase involved in cell wall biosynthesis